MARVKTFFINPGTGVPDFAISEFISAVEKEAIVRVQAVYIPAVHNECPRITVIVTELDGV
jgi:hypothetical protein